jgi:hypothetical protein
MILTGETEVWSIDGMILTGETEVWSIDGMILTGETEVWSVVGMVQTGETEVWSVGGMVLTGETEVLGEASVPLLLGPPQISHEQNWDRTCTSTVSGRPLTASAMVRS